MKNTGSIEDTIQLLQVVAEAIEHVSKTNSSPSSLTMRKWFTQIRTCTNTLSRSIAADHQNKSEGDKAAIRVEFALKPNPPPPPQQQQQRLQLPTVGIPSPSPRQTAPLSSRRPSFTSTMGTIPGQEFQTPQRSTTLGNVVSGGFSILLECVQHLLRAQRVCVYQLNQTYKQLQLVAGVGALGHAKLRTPLSSEKGIVNLVFITRIAANLSQCHMDDAVDVKGVEPSSQCTLCFPLLSTREKGNCLGVIQVCNKYNSGTPFHAGDETTLFMASQIISYYLEQYAIDVAAHVVDLAPLHNLFPPRTYTDNTTTEGVESDELRNVFETIGKQLIFRTENAGKYLRTQHLTEKGVPMEAEGTARQVLEADLYIQKLENCWYTAIEETMEHEEREATHLSHTNDVRELLRRKQKKLQLLKEAIRDEVMTNISYDVKLKEMSQRLTEFESEEEERRIARASRARQLDRKRSESGYIGIGI